MTQVWITDEHVNWKRIDIDCIGSETELKFSPSSAIINGTIRLELTNGRMMTWVCHYNTWRELTVRPATDYPIPVPDDQGDLWFKAVVPYTRLVWMPMQ